MSGSIERLANPLGAGVPNPGTVVGAGVGGGMGPAGPPPGNPLTAGGVPGPMPRQASPVPRNYQEAHKALQAEHGRAKALFEQTGKALGSLDHVKKGLERLADKGDVVQHEDVIHEAGRLVAHGIDPITLAGILADMPQQGGGEALAGWVTGHAVAAAQAEQQLVVAHKVAGHQLAVASIHMIRSNDMGHRLNGPPPEEMMDGGNALGGQPANVMADGGGDAGGNGLGGGGAVG